MEFEDMRKKIEWEARRVAAAFGVREWSHDPICTDRNHFFEGYAGESWVEWNVADAHTGDIAIMVGLRGTDHEFCSYSASPFLSTLYKSYPVYNAHMVRGLYQLGIDDEEVTSQFNYQLSAHEKLELHLSMPREFWPQTWREEEVC